MTWNGMVRCASHFSFKPMNMVGRPPLIPITLFLLPRQPQVDSDDLPLNVSREMLQQHKLIKVIKKKLVRKALDMFKKMDAEEYIKFWKEYGTNIKLGVVEDPTNKTRLAKLLRFVSSNHPTDLTSLEEYLERMKDKQDHIYFMAAPSKEEAEASPFVERLLRKGYEVLYLVDPVDEYTTQVRAQAHTLGYY